MATKAYRELDSYYDRPTLTCLSTFQDAVFSQFRHAPSGTAKHIRIALLVCLLAYQDARMAAATRTSPVMKWFNFRYTELREHLISLVDALSDPEWQRVRTNMEDIAANRSGVGQFRFVIFRVGRPDDLNNFIADLDVMRSFR